MKKYILTACLIIVACLMSVAQSSSHDSNIDKAQQTSELSKHIFAPNIISLPDRYEFGSALSMDQNEIYFGVRLNEEWKAEICYSKFVNGSWTNPVRLDLDERYTYNDPFLSADESRLFFVSNMPLDRKGEPKDFDIWYIEKNDNGWSDPINIGSEINTDKNEFYVSISQNGTIYFVSNRHTTTEEDKWNCDIYYSELIKDKYQKPVRLSKLVNSEHFEIDPFISPDESYLIFASMKPGGLGQGDLYISFKDEEGNWKKATNMGEIINTEYHEFCPQVSKDGRYLYYTSNGDIYLINSGIVDGLNQNNK